MTKTYQFSEVCEITMGQAPAGESYNTDGIGLPLIAGAGDFGDLHPAPKKFTTEVTRKCRKDDIVLGIRASIGEKVWADKDYCLGRGVAGLRPRRGVDRNYLWHWLTHINPELLSRAKGATFKQVNKDDVGSLKIALPTFDEQCRIATILDKAESLRTKRREALFELDKLAQAIFIEMFGDPIENDRHWPLGPVSDFVADFETGKNLIAEDDDAAGSKFKVLKISAVTSLEYRPEQNKPLPSDYQPPASHFVRPGDLLFSRANTRELIGATAYVDETPENIVLPDKLWRFSWHNPSKTAPLYVRQLFRQPRFREEIGRRATGTSGSMQNISKAKVLSIMVGQPPLSLQLRFAEQVRIIEAQKSLHRISMNALDDLFCSLQNHAFRVSRND